MKKLITIILALIMTLFSTPQKGANQPHVTTVKTPQTAITAQAEQVPEEREKSAETAFVSEVTEAETTTEAPKKEAPVVQETVTEECTEVTEEIIPEPEEDTVPEKENTSEVQKVGANTPTFLRSYKTLLKMPKRSCIICSQGSKQ